MAILPPSALAQDNSGYLAPAANYAGFGSGPMAVSLIGSARMTAPIRGSEPENQIRQNDVAAIAARDLPRGGSPAAEPFVAARATPREVHENLAFAR